MIRIRTALERLRDDDDESGLSIVELLVSMVIAAALLAVVASFFLTTTRATVSSDQTRVASTTAGTIASQVSTAIRFATPIDVQGATVPAPAIVEGSGTSLTLYTLLDSGSAALVPLKVRYRIVNGQWVESRWIGTTSGRFTTFSPTAPPRDLVLGGTVVPQTAVDRQPFVFRGEDGGVIGTGGALTAAQIAAVRTIQINVDIRATDSGPITSLTNTVGMPNLGYTGASS